MAEDEWNSEGVARLRYDLGWSQEKLSNALGVRQQTVSDWETGLHRPTGASVRLLSIVKEQAASYTTARDRPGRGKRGRRRTS